MSVPNPVDVAKVLAEAESWLKTYPTGAEAIPSDAWDWLNGRAHPRLVLALCERIAELERKQDPSAAVDGGWGGK